MESPKKKGGKRTSVRAPNSTSATAVPGSKPQIVENVREHDILMGRGAPTINYQGNVSFRELVSTRKAEYTASGRHRIKDEIARQVVEEVARRNGRFLRRVETSAEAEALGIPENKKAWIIADDDIAMEKVKQALRDKDPVKEDPQEDVALFPNGRVVSGTPSMHPSSSAQGASLASLAQIPQLFDSTSLAPSSMNMAAAQPLHLLELLQQQFPGHQAQAAARANPMMEQQYMDLLERQLREQQAQENQSYMRNASQWQNSTAGESLLSYGNSQGAMAASSSLSMLPMQQFGNAGRQGNYEQAALALLREGQRQETRNLAMLTEPSYSQLDEFRALQHMGTSVSQNPNPFLNQQDLGPQNLFSTNGLSSGIRNAHELSAQTIDSLDRNQTSLFRNSVAFPSSFGSYGDSTQGTNLHHVTSVLNRDSDFRLRMDAATMQNGSPGGLGGLTAVAPTPAVNSLLSSLLRQQAAVTGSSAPPLLLTPAASMPIATGPLNSSTKQPTSLVERMSTAGNADNIHPALSSEEDGKPRAKKTKVIEALPSESSSEASSVASKTGGGSEKLAHHTAVKKARLT